MSQRDSVWVTGVGMVTPLGGTAPESLRRLFAGDSGIGALSLFSLPGAKSDRAAEVKSLAHRPGVCARTDRMAVQAAEEALVSAGLLRSDDPARRSEVLATDPIALVVGGSTAGMFETEELLTQLGQGPIDQALSARLRTHPLSSTMDVLSEELGPFQFARTVCCACTSGLAAIALGATWIRLGLVERVLAGGADALCRLTYSGFGSLSVLSPEDCRPFDRTRSGLNLGEGAAFVVLERGEVAARRGVAPIAHIAGYGLGGEAHHITHPEPSGQAAVRIMRSALASGGLRPSDVDYVNAHGTATAQNDAAEAKALRLCFGEHRVLVSSSKGHIGHTLAAAGAIEAVIATAAASTGQVPGTLRLGAPDPETDLDHVRQTVEVGRPLRVMTNSFGFGGTGGSLIVSGPDAALRPIVRDRIVVTGAAVVGLGRVVMDDELADWLREPGADEPEVREPPAPIDFACWLDPNVTRRMDRTAKLTALAMERALFVAARGAATPPTRTDLAAVSASAFGNVDGSMRFMKRVLDKGAQFASPADFPNLVPSSPVSHAAILLGLGGPAIAAPDLSSTAESSFLTGVELILGGLAAAAVVGTSEEVSPLAERVIAPLLGVRTVASNSEGASALVLEAATGAARRGARIFAEVRFFASRRDARAASEAPVPEGRALVVDGGTVEIDALLEGSPWARVARKTLCPSASDHVGRSGTALAAAAAWISLGRADQILFVGGAPGRSYAIVLARAAG